MRLYSTLLMNHLHFIDPIQKEHVKIASLRNKKIERICSQLNKILFILIDVRAFLMSSNEKGKHNNSNNYS